MKNFENNLPRMRVAKAAADLLRAMDPETEITEATLRRMAKAGIVPAVKVGSRILINVDWIIQKLEAGETITIQKEKPAPGMIRPLEEKRLKWIN